MGGVVACRARLNTSLNHEIPKGNYSYGEWRTVLYAAKPCNSDTKHY